MKSLPLKMERVVMKCAWCRRDLVVEVKWERQNDQVVAAFVKHRHPCSKDGVARGRDGGILFDEF